MNFGYYASMNRRTRSAMQAVGVGLLILTFATALIATAAPAETKGADGERWYRILLKQGETSDGYQWGMAASGPKGKPLAKICNIASTLAPQQPDQPFVEGDELTACGSLKRPKDSAAVSIEVGSGASKSTILGVLFRPIVRKVIFALETGERRVYKAKVPKVPNRAASGIPFFRYVVASFEAETCIRRVATFDRQGAPILREVRPPCA